MIKLLITLIGLGIIIVPLVAAFGVAPMNPISTSGEMVITDFHDNEIENAEVEQIILIKTRTYSNENTINTSQITGNDITTISSKSEPITNIIQIRDSTNMLVYLSWNEAELYPGDTMQNTFSWIPATPGEYTIANFVWTSIINPTSLAAPISKGIVVSHGVHPQPPETDHTHRWETDPRPPVSGPPTLEDMAGDTISESKLALQSDMKYGKLKHMDTIKINYKTIDYLGTKITSSGDVTRFYGTVDTFFDTQLFDIFMSEGGIAVKTRILATPEVVFAAIANSPEPQSRLSYVNGVVAILYDGHDSGMSRVSLYPGDQRNIAISANISLNDLIDIAKKLDEVDQGLDLEEYKDPNWGTNIDNGPDSEPETEPEPAT